MKHRRNSMDTRWGQMNELRHSFQLPKMEKDDGDILTPKDTIKELGNFMQNFFIDSRKTALEAIRDGFRLVGVNESRECGVPILGDILRYTVHTRKSRLKAITLPPVDENTRKLTINAIVSRDQIKSEEDIVQAVRHYLKHCSIKALEEFLMCFTAELAAPTKKIPIYVNPDLYAVCRRKSSREK
mmetsp:Transcript_8736/g.14182  ORF Transcript_8736/g.14182 Transcript_8736/m.14182 type:complete len:185 (+) Transcript_8736:1665-2219(+)